MCKPHSRRDFFRNIIGNSLAGAAILDLAVHRAAWAQAAAQVAPADLFILTKVAEGVYFAAPRPQAILNCNAAIFVNSKDVLVVDAHSKPSAAAALIAQIKKDITPLPVRYLVDTHFHWDHSHGNAAYKAAKAEIIASATTKRLMTELSAARLHISFDPNGKPRDAQTVVPIALENARKQLETAGVDQRGAIETRIRQLESYQDEMRNFAPTLPTITFDKSYVIKDKAHDLHIEFHGRAHTAGDVMVYCPQKKVIATGDAILGILPFMIDSYPQEWGRTIESAAKLDIDFVLPGHGGVQQGKAHMLGQRDYLDEITGVVEKGKRDGLSLEVMQKRVTVESLKTLAGAYGAAVGRNLAGGVAANVEHIYNRLIL
jgi:glyoxylase-like metal-dependent hydrolase (beta-lactamase superfamily II)